MTGPIADRQAVIGAVTLNYRLAGKGTEPLVCIHGVGSSLEAWEPIVELLSDQYRILTLDLRGHGKSSLVRGFYDIDQMVAEVVGLASIVGFDQFNLVGFSLGGLIAQRLALTHPASIKRLMLLSTVTGRNDEERARVQARLLALQTGDRGAHYDASLSRWLTEDFQLKNPELILKLRARNASNDPACYASAYRVLAESDYGDSLNQIDCPTLIVTGEEDSGSNPRMARFMHEQIAGSKLVIFPKLRHSILIEAPALVAKTLDEFMYETPLRGA